VLFVHLSELKDENLYLTNYSEFAILQSVLPSNNLTQRERGLVAVTLLDKIIMLMLLNLSFI